MSLHANMAPSRRRLLDQYGMEYNPVAINEVLAYRMTPDGSAPGQPRLRRAGQHADAYPCPAARASPGCEPPTCQTPTWAASATRG